MLLDTPICDFGWEAIDFTLKDAHGKAYTMRDHLGDKGLLIVFMCNHCPYVIKIAQRLAEDTKMLMDEGIGVLGIMSNDYEAYPEDAPDNMKKFVADHGFSFPYLVDEVQSVAKTYGAVCTPDFFGFNSKGELQYRGRLDDARMDESTDRVPELINAMRMIAKSGKGPKDQIPSMGCSIKWK